MLALINCDVFCGEQVHSDKAVLIDGDRISGLVKLDSLPPNTEKVDLKGCNVAPGFIDLQVNGGGGVLVDGNLSIEGLHLIAMAHRKYGTTAYLPTLITSSAQDAFHAISIVREAMSKPELGVLGLHMEGPYLNPDKAGVHDKKLTRRASLEEVSGLIMHGRDVIRLMTVAPEMIDGSVLNALAGTEWRLSIGHSNADYISTTEALKAGFGYITHLFNAMSQFGSREPGIVGAAFDSDSTCAGIIVDGFHVDYAAVRIAKKVMQDRLFLVTDAMPPVGSNVNVFTLGEYTVTRSAEKLTTSGGVLAGSCLDMASAVRNCVQKAGISLPEALRMASLYPAKALGLHHHYGRVKEGYKADLVVFNNQVQVVATVKNGRLSAQQI